MEKNKQKENFDVMYKEAYEQSQKYSKEYIRERIDAVKNKHSMTDTEICNLMTGFVKELFETRIKLQEMYFKLVENDSAKVTQGLKEKYFEEIGKLTQLEIEYRDVAARYLVYILDKKSSVDELVKAIGIDVTDEMEVVSDLGEFSQKPAFTKEQLQEYNKSFSVNNGKVLIVHNNRAILLPAIHFVVADLQNAKYKNLSRELLVPFTNGELPKNPELASKMLVYDKYGKMHGKVVSGGLYY